MQGCSMLNNILIIHNKILTYSAANGFHVRVVRQYFADKAVKAAAVPELIFGICGISVWF
ncbi:MAG TPA: hypothetical protein DCQ37_05605 [Desulfobacteraceae bacterium]|nr:hypothetical protein [Desulfobacteraceae bacterium]